MNIALVAPSGVSGGFATKLDLHRFSRGFHVSILVDGCLMRLSTLRHGRIFGRRLFIVPEIAYNVQQGGFII